MNLPLHHSIAPESPTDMLEVEQLAAEAFGPGRFVRTAFRLREGVAHEPSLSFVYRVAEEIVASVRLTKILIGADVALLLGPLVVRGEFKNMGYGSMLMRTCLEAARAQNHDAVLLVGDLSYYGKFGFERVPPGVMQMPGPVDPARLLVCPLKLADGQELCGPVRQFQDRVPDKNL